TPILSATVEVNRAARRALVVLSGFLRDSHHRRDGDEWGLRSVVPDQLLADLHGADEFWFNGGAVVAIAGSNVLADLRGGHWVILALIWPFGFALHGITLHLFWTIRQRNLSPGLVTSVLYWIMAYFFVRYGLLTRQIDASDFWTGVLLGVLTVSVFLTFVPTMVVPRMIRSRMQQTTD